MSAQAADRPVPGTPEPGASHAAGDEGRMAGADAPAAPNQQKTEPIPPSGSGDGSGDGAPGADTHGVPVPSDVPAPGTSEEAAPVDGVAYPAVAYPAVAQEGLADGETDVTMPSTTHF